MKKQFIPYEQALELKELGFDEKCFAYFNGETVTRMSDRGTLSIDKINTYRNTFLSIKNQQPFVYTPEPGDADTNPMYERLKWGITVSTPLWQQAFDWFREKHNLYFEIFNSPMYVHHAWKFRTYTIENNRLRNAIISENFGTYQEAKEAALVKLISLTKNP
jgi:hypothetical protein